MMELGELIERVEKLTGPDREVDCEIAWATGWDIEATNYSGTWRRAFPSWRGVGERTHRAADNWGVPPFTASLDAAVALVERVLPAWSWECRASGTGDKGQATVWNPIKAPGHNDEQLAYNCPSPAIALVLATLRAVGRKP